MYENYIKTISTQLTVLEPIDFCDILNYMKYHQGSNQKTMDEYYKIFIPCLKIHLDNKNYKQFIDSVNLLLKSVLYQYEWDGTNSKYLDTEYQYHLYYIREIVRIPPRGAVPVPGAGFPLRGSKVRNGGRGLQVRT